MAVFVAVAAKIVGYTVVPIWKQIGYLIFYKRNVVNLKSEVKMLRDKKGDLESWVEEEHRHVRDITREVKSWLQRVDQIDEEVTTILENEAKVKKGCFVCRCCLGLKSLYSLSRKAHKKTPHIVKLREEGTFGRDQIVCPAPPPKLASIFAGNDFLDFQSRMMLMEEIMETLAHDDTVGVIGICGMGGIGKTKMAEKIVKRVEDEKLFDEVAMVVVSQQPDIHKIQDEIAKTMGFELENDGGLARAAEILEKLTKKIQGETGGDTLGGSKWDRKGKSVLIILDDVWFELDFQNIGLPSVSIGAHNSYKIVLTSRNEDVCSLMGSNKNFRIPILPTEEALDLFWKMAGNTSDKGSIGAEIAAECGGLPIALVTVGKTLARKRIYVWEDALQQLRNGIHGKAHSSIELSYKYLESDEAKTLFLLCCIFPEDYDIPIESLVRHGMGLKLFSGACSVRLTRIRVHTLVDKLRSSFLLLDSYREECVKMHDVVRDIGITIVYNKEYEGSEPPNITKGVLNTMKWYNEIFKISPFSFEGLEPPKVLDISNKFLIQSLSASPKLFKNLHCLSLKHCHLENKDLSFIGALRNLESLSFAFSDIQRLPLEIGLLRALILLDLTGCRDLKIIAPGVLSCLQKLEEFHALGTSVEWEIHEKGKEAMNASLAELEELPCLTTLRIHTHHVEHFPQDLLFKTLVRFQILIGDCSFGTESIFWETDPVYLFQTSLCVRLKTATSCHLESLIYALMKKADSIALEVEVEDGDLLKNLFKFDRVEVWGQLKTITLKYCEGLEYMVGVMKKGKGHIQGSSFSNLRSIEIIWCNKLKSVFPLSIAKGLVQLKTLTVGCCEMVEEIFSRDGGDDFKASCSTITIELPKLKKLSLYQLPNFISFGKAVDTLELPKLRKLELINVGSMKNLFPRVSSASSEVRHNAVLQSSIKAEIQHDQVQSMPFSESSVILDQLQNLGSIKLEGLYSLEVVFDPEYMQSIKEERLACSPLEAIELTCLPKLTEIWKGPHNCYNDFRNLKKLVINKCGSLRHVFSPSTASALLQLQILQVRDCYLIDEIVGTKVEEEKEATGNQLKMVSFPKLHSLCLINLQSFESICKDSTCAFEWPLLEDVSVHKCPKVETLPFTIFLKNAPKLKAASITLPGNPHLIRYPRNSFNENLEFVREVSLRYSTNFEVKGVDMWCDQPQLDGLWFLSNLKSMKLQFCELLSISDLSRLLPRLVNLKELHFFSCRSLELIFDLEVQHAQEEDETRVLEWLTILSIRMLPKLTCIWMNATLGIKRFQNLSQLSVLKCNSLSNILPLFMTESLVNLRELYVDNCSMVQEIIAGRSSGLETEADKTITSRPILLPQLQVMILENLPNLESICDQGIRDFELPSLKKVIVTNCHKMKTFSYGASIVQKEYQNFTTSESHNFFKGKVSLTRLENLERLQLYGCDSLEVLFNFEGQDQDGNNQVVLVIDSLTYLYLSNLANLRHLLKGCPKEIRGFQNLTIISVKRCKSLRYMFSPSLASGLLELRRLEVCDCSLMEEIVATAEKAAVTYQMETILFPKLTYFKLEDLPNLKAICTESDSFEWPLLEEVEVNCCPKIETHPLTFLMNAPKLKKACIIECVDREVLLDDNKFVMIGVDIWLDQRQLDRICFLSNLEVMGLQLCEQLSTSYLCQILQRLLNLEQLDILRCASLELMFDLEQLNAKEEDEARVLKRLKRLFMHELPNLTCIWKNATLGIQRFQNLQYLEVFKCNNLSNILPPFVAKNLWNLRELLVKDCNMVEEIIASRGSGEETEDENTTASGAVLPQLISVELENLPNLKHFGRQGIHDLELPLLEAVIVENCPMMKTLSYGLLCTSMLEQECQKYSKHHYFKRKVLLTSITTLCVNKIKNLTKISYGEIEGGSFCNLEELRIRECPNLLNIFPSNLITSLSKLEQLRLEGCGSLEVLFNLEELDQNVGDNQVDPVLDLLTNLDICRLTNLKHILLKRGPQEMRGFSSLTILHVEECNSLKYLFSPSMAKLLLNIREICIIDCQMMEQVIVRQEDDEDSITDVVVFPKLKWLRLEDLPNLTCFCIETCTISCPMQVEFSVVRCPELNTFILPEFQAY